MPKRVARQFGRVQGIPPSPIDFDRSRSNLGVAAKGYKKVYGPTVSYWNEMGNHSYPLGYLGSEAVVPDHTTPDYAAWYARITHVRVHNPEHGENNVHVNPMHGSAQNRLRHVMQNTNSLFQQVSQDPQCPNYVNTGLDVIAQHAGTAILPNPGYWGPQQAYPPEQFTQPIQHGWWNDYPYPYYHQNQPNNPDEDNNN